MSRSAGSTTYPLQPRSGSASRRIAGDWQSRWGYQPVLMETFVDPRHGGSSYKAAGWQYLGMSTGEGLVREGCTYTTSPKKIFVKPLRKEFRQVLCSEYLKAETER